MAEERKCAWCGADLPEGCTARRTLCSGRCKKARYNEKHREKINHQQKLRNKTQPGREARRRYRLKKAIERGIAKAIRKKSKAEMVAARKSQILSEMMPRPCLSCEGMFSPKGLGAKYCSKQCKHREKSRRRRFRHPEMDRYFRLSHIDEYRSRERDRSRRRAAAAAISMLILPIEKETEE